jgi:hypothetical protein
MLPMIVALLLGTGYLACVFIEFVLGVLDAPLDPPARRVVSTPRCHAERAPAARDLSSTALPAA